MALTVTVNFPPDRDPYWQAMERASFYSWNARRGFALPGNDPLTGRPRKEWPSDKGESRAAYAAMARYWLYKARELRRAGR
jgi:hypothetical protein